VWSEAMQERVSRGESIGDFCKRKGISRNTYFYWQRKLREAACRELSAKPESENTAIVPGGWAVLGPDPEPAETLGGVTIEIGKCRITATSATDPELLGKICRALMSEC